MTKSPDAPDLAGPIAAVRRSEELWCSLDEENIGSALVANLRTALRVLEALADREWIRDAIRMAIIDNPDEPHTGLLAALLARAAER